MKGIHRKKVELTLEVTIPVTVEVIDDPGDEITPPYSAVSLYQYDQKHVLDAVLSAVHQHISNYSEEIAEE